MNKVNVPLHQVTIRRDANTITPVTVARYELQLLRQMFGKENVADNGQVNVIEVDVTTEYERLCAKYGQAKIAKVYGDDGGASLAESIIKSEAKETDPAAGRAPAESKSQAKNKK